MERKFLFKVPKNIEKYDHPMIQGLLDGSVNQIQFLKSMKENSPYTLEGGKLKILTQEEINSRFETEVKNMKMKLNSGLNSISLSVIKENFDLFCKVFPEFENARKDVNGIDKDKCTSCAARRIMKFLNNIWYQIENKLERDLTPLNDVLNDFQKKSIVGIPIEEKDFIGTFKSNYRDMKAIEKSN